ncbi:phosphatase PAP2 family protein [Neisseria animaloris]|uniref:phosphatase PAP2 family protein n=1 Tax=Neisseria animaloris TaxID=326522 RepID=UPI000D2F7D1A|nr:phosphatase PAP2 family protein [Neisseria animaloris]
MLPLRAYIPPFPRLLVLFLGIVIPLVIAGFIADDIRAQQHFVFEQPLMMWVHEHAGEAFTPVAIVLHHLGKSAVAIPITVLFALWLYLRRRRGYALFVLLGAALSTAVMFTAKQFFNRPRPEFWPRIVEETNASFPSGHSTFAAAIATLIVLVYWYSPYRKYIIAAAVAFTLLMGFSRIVLGVHYPTDVLVGWITGVSTVLGLHLVLFRKPPEST